MAPSARLRPGSGTTSDSSYSSTAPKPLQAPHAPRGLLNEKSAGVTVAAGVSHTLQAGQRVKRRRPPSCIASAMPSPSWNATATASESRPSDAADPPRRSTTTSSSPARVRSSDGGSSSRWWARPIGDHPDEAEGTEVLDDGRMGQPGHRREWKRDLDAAHARGDDLVGGRLGRVHPHRRPAGPAEAPADPRPQEAQVVVHLGGGPHGGAAGHHRIPLLDGDRRGDALEPVHQRLGHAVEELLGVGGERLDVPPLPLGVQGVEGERALARSRGTGDDRERAVRQVDGDTLQVVLASVDDADDGIGHAGT